MQNSTITITTLQQYLIQVSLIGKMAFVDVYLSKNCIRKRNSRKNKDNFIKNLRSMQTSSQNYDGVRIGPPPDLPSLLLHNRIVYLGMPLVPAVTELIVAEFLFLQYENSEKPVFMYLNSTGTSNPDGSSAGFETEAFAIADTMSYIRPPVHTICVGQAFGTSAMLLSSGEPCHRAALPNATIMIHQPRSQARGQASDIAIKAREVLYNRKQCFEIIAKTSGQSLQKVMKDASRTKYLSPQEAIEYGIIDKILESPKKSLFSR
nr:ATP-dependent Clp protease proteolytic subunit [Cryptomonas sp.]